jgi:hypothetical protein
MMLKPQNGLDDDEYKALGLAKLDTTIVERSSSSSKTTHVGVMNTKWD